MGEPDIMLIDNIQASNNLRLLGHKNILVADTAMT
jgi:hypothetical protein